MDEPLREKIALFRFSVIGPLINSQLEHGELKKQIRSLSKRKYTIPGTTRRFVGEGTISEWMGKYRDKGFEGLKPKMRRDKGRCRSVPRETLAIIAAKKHDNPRRPVNLICQDLYKQGKIDSFIQPIATLYRHLKVKKLKKLDSPKKQQKRFEHQFSNQMWQADVMYGPFVPHKKGGRPKRTYLFDIIDDASRLIVGAKFYVSEKLIHLKDVFKQAVITYGVPAKLFVDNGKIFKAHELEVACAKLSTALIFSTPYYPEGKAKVEKFHRRVREHLLTDIHDVTTLDELNEKFEEWLQNQYNRSPHQGIGGKTPLEKYLERTSHIRRLPAHIDVKELFYHEEQRQVGKDATFRINNILYEAPEYLIGNKIQVLFDSDDMDKVKIRFQGKDEGYCNPIDYIGNSRLKRKPVEPKLNFYDLLNPNQEDDDDISSVHA